VKKRNSNSQAFFRARIVKLDGERCRNPLHGELMKSLGLKMIAILRFMAHHIKYRSQRGKNTAENGIMFCQYCDHAVHHGVGKGEDRLAGRQYMLKILDALESASDYRWSEVHAELRKRYGAVA